MASFAVRTSDAIAHSAYRFIISRSPVPWDDGWAGRTTRFLVRGNEGTNIVITGRIPGTNANERTQRLKVLIDGSPVDEVSLPVGEFNLVYLAPSYRNRRVSARAVSEPSDATPPFLVDVHAKRVWKASGTTDSVDRAEG